MTAPKRIQRRRTKGWRMPDGTVYVGRPTKWGNPYRGPDAAHLFATELRDCHARPYDDAYPIEIRTIAEEVHELAGYDLACWCPLDQPCHADVLLELANADTDHPELCAVCLDGCDDQEIEGPPPRPIETVDTGGRL